MKERFHEIQQATGSTKKQLAAIMGINYVTFFRYINEERVPDFLSLQKLFRHFNINPNWFFNQSGNVTLDPAAPSLNKPEGVKYVPLIVHPRNNMNRLDLTKIVTHIPVISQTPADDLFFLQAQELDKLSTVDISDYVLLTRETQIGNGIFLFYHPNYIDSASLVKITMSSTIAIITTCQDPLDMTAVPSSYINPNIHILGQVIQIRRQVS